MSRWILLASLCIAACVSDVGEQRADEETAEVSQELGFIKCSVWRNRQLIFEGGTWYPDPDRCCLFNYCHPCEIYSCTFP